MCYFIERGLLPCPIVSSTLPPSRTIHGRFTSQWRHLVKYFYFETSRTNLICGVHMLVADIYTSIDAVLLMLCYTISNDALVDGEWDPWSEWSECPVTCGGSTRMRTRLCQKPLYGGSPCRGDDEGYKPCALVTCFSTRHLLTLFTFYDIIN